MFYVFTCTPTADNSEDTPETFKLQLTAGIIHQVDVLFQAGCDHQQFIQLYDDAYQVWPSNRGEKLRGDATVVSFRDFYEVKPGNTTLTAKVWSTLGAGWKDMVLNIGMLPKSVLQPFSLAELLRAVQKR